MAVMAGVEVAVRLHIERGDDLNARDDRQLTPLMIAASRNRPAICRLLLEAGADVRLLDPSGNDALSIARASGAGSAAAVIETALHNVTGPSVPQSRAPLVNGVSYSPITDSFDWDQALTPDTDAHRTPPSASTDEGGPDEGDEYDLSGWEIEEERPPPEDDATIPQAAAAGQRAISDYVPTDTSRAWNDFEAFLPERASPLPLVTNAKARAELRHVLLLAIRDGTVARRILESVAVDDDGARDEAAESRLRLVLNHLGASIDACNGDTWPAKSADVYPDPVESHDEEDAVAYALALLQEQASHLNESVRFCIREAQYGRPTSAEEEVALAKSMEHELARALDVLATWPDGLSRVLEAAELVRAGEKPLEWITSGAPVEVPSEGEPAGGNAAVDGGGTSTEGDDDADDYVGPVGALGLSDEPKRVFFERISALASLAGGDIPQGAQSSAVRDALSGLSIRRSVLIALGEATSFDRSPAAVRFADAIRSYRGARDRMATANLELVLSIARRYKGSGLALDDLIQEGAIGLLKAVDRFDWRRGFRFATMATWWIRQRVSRAVADLGLTIRLPVHVHEVAQRLHREAEDVENATGARPSFQFLGERLSLPLRKVDALLRATAVPARLDVLDSRAYTDCAQSVDPLEEVAAEQLRRTVNDILGDLGHRPEQVLRLRFGIGVPDTLTLEEIGARFGVTRERIRQIEVQSLERLQHPSRQISLRPWYSDDPLEPRASVVAAHKVEDRAPNLGGAVGGCRVAKPRQNTADASKVAAIDRLLARARAIGVPVEEDRSGTGTLWVRIPDGRTRRNRSLVRKLLALGFKHSPGEGYSR
jgi:RNA polymerase primary sigma factor